MTDRPPDSVNTSAREEPLLDWVQWSSRAPDDWWFPLYRIEWLARFSAQYLRTTAQAWVQLLEHFGRLAVAGSVVASLFLFIGNLDDQERSRHYQAWLVINGAFLKGGSGGRIEALEDLASDDVALDGVNLNGAMLRGLILQSASLRFAGFKEADLNGANFVRSDLYEAELSQANLGAAKLAGATLRGAKLDGVCLALADLSGGDLQRSERGRKADLSKSDLTDANLRGALLDTAQLGEAILRGADLRGADLSNASLDRADLANVNVDGDTLLDPKWKQVVEIVRSRKPGKRLVDRDLRQAGLQSAALDSADLSGADLTAADLSNASLRFAVLRGAVIQGVTLAGADLRGVSGVTCEGLGAAYGWDSALRDPALYCGKPLLEPPVRQTPCDRWTQRLMTGEGRRGGLFPAGIFPFGVGPY